MESNNTENKLTLALNIIRRYINGEAVSDDEVFYAFPGLKESEDERTNRELSEFISSIKQISESGRTTWAVREEDAGMCERFLAYLERQKEQKKDNPLEDYSRGYNAGYYHGITDSEQKPAEWSEEDEKNYNLLLNHFRQAFEHRATSLTWEEIEKIYYFLQHLRPQPHWKPSGEQMKALNRTILLTNFGAEKERWDAMSSLYNDLLKLIQP